MGPLRGKLRHAVKSGLQLAGTGLGYKLTVVHGPVGAAPLPMQAPLAPERLSHSSGTTGWQRPEEEAGIASPPAIPTTPHPALTNTWLTRLW